MAASILSFRRRPAVPSRDWAEQEKAEFFRVIDVLGRSGLVLELETGVTDEGEPWAAFCALESGDPVVHIARLDGRYVLAATTMAAPIQGADLRELVRQSLDNVPAAVMPKPAGRPGGAVPYLHPAALLLVLVATSWFQALHAAESLPGAADPKLSDRQDAPFGDAPAAAVHLAPTSPDATSVGQEAYGDAAELSAQRFQQAVTIAVALLSLNGTAANLTVPPPSPEVGEILGTAEAATAPRTHVAEPTPDKSPTETELRRYPAAPTDTVLSKAMAAEQLEAAPSQSLTHSPAASQPANGQAAASLTGPHATASLAGGTVDGGGADHILAWRPEGAELQFADNGAIANDKPTAAKQVVALEPGGTVKMSTDLAAHSHAPSPPALRQFSDAEATLSLAAPGKSALSLDQLPAEVAQKLAALIATADIPLALIAPAGAHAAVLGLNSDEALEHRASGTPTIGAADASVSPKGPAAVLPEAAEAAAPAPAPAETPTVPSSDATQHQSAVTPAQLATLPASATLISNDGTHGVQAQQVTLDTALAQLQHFTASTSNYITIVVAKLLILIDQALLANTQMPHSFSSFQMPDGSEITWVHPVGIADTPWQF